MIDPRAPNFASTPAQPGPERAGRMYAMNPDDPRVRTFVPQVSVVTPVFNPDAALMAQTAQCVLGQSLQTFEWIIVNDGSTSPEAAETLRAYRDLSARDPRVRVVDHERNRGISAARNTGVRLARAAYVFLIDADDLIEPTTLEKSALTLGACPAFDVAHGLGIGFGGQEYLWSHGFHDGPAFLEQNLVTATGMLRRSLVDHVGWFDETIRGGSEDWEFWLRCAERGRWGCTIPEYLEWYRRRAEGDSGPWSNLESDRAREAFRAGLRERFPRVFSGAWPTAARDTPQALDEVPMDAGLVNPLKQDRPGVVLLGGRLDDSWLTRHLLDLARGLQDVGWNATVCAETGELSAMAAAARVTPDVFVLDHYGPARFHPCFIRHLIESRGASAVIICGWDVAYAISGYLRASASSPAVVDFTHGVDESWRRGGHARDSVAWGAAGQIDLSLVATRELAAWMTARGRDPAKVAVCDVPAGDHAALGRAAGGPLAEAARRRTASTDPELSPGLLQEMLVQAVEMVRVQRLADELWRRVTSGAGASASA